jgi:hypothetical protein
VATSGVRIAGCIYADHGYGERWPQLWRFSGGASGRQSMLIGRRLVIGWHGDVEVTEGDGSVTESDAELMSVVKPRPTAPLGHQDRVPTTQTTTRSSSLPPTRR